MIAEILKRNFPIEILEIANANRNTRYNTSRFSKRFSVILKAPENNHTVHTVNFRGKNTMKLLKLLENFLQESGTFAIGELLMKNTTITNLDIMGNH